VTTREFFEEETGPVAIAFHKMRTHIGKMSETDKLNIVFEGKSTDANLKDFYRKFRKTKLAPEPIVFSPWLLKLGKGGIHHSGPEISLYKHCESVAFFAAWCYGQALISGKIKEQKEGVERDMRFLFALAFSHDANKLYSEESRSPTLQEIERIWKDLDLAKYLEIATEQDIVPFFYGAVSGVEVRGGSWLLSNPNEIFPNADLIIMAIRTADSIFGVSQKNFESGAFSTYAEAFANTLSEEKYTKALSENFGAPATGYKSFSLSGPYNIVKHVFEFLLESLREEEGPDNFISLVWDGPGITFVVPRSEEHKVFEIFDKIFKKMERLENFGAVVNSEDQTLEISIRSAKELTYEVIVESICEKKIWDKILRVYDPSMTKISTIEKWRKNVLIEGKQKKSNMSIGKLKNDASEIGKQRLILTSAIVIACGNSLLRLQHLFQKLTPEEISDIRSELEKKYVEIFDWLHKGSSLSFDKQVFEPFSNKQANAVKNSILVLLAATFISRINPQHIRAEEQITRDLLTELLNIKDQFYNIDYALEEQNGIKEICNSFRKQLGIKEYSNLTIRKKFQKSCCVFCGRSGELLLKKKLGLDISVSVFNNRSGRRVSPFKEKIAEEYGNAICGICLVENKYSTNTNSVLPFGIYVIEPVQQLFFPTKKMILGQERQDSAYEAYELFAFLQAEKKTTYWWLLVFIFFAIRSLTTGRQIHISTFTKNTSSRSLCVTGMPSELSTFICPEPLGLSRPDLLLAIKRALVLFAAVSANDNEKKAQPFISNVFREIHKYGWWAIVKSINQEEENELFKNGLSYSKEFFPMKHEELFDIMVNDLYQIVSKGLGRNVSQTSKLEGDFRLAIDAWNAAIKTNLPLEDSVGGALVSKFRREHTGISESTVETIRNFSKSFVEFFTKTKDLRSSNNISAEFAKWLIPAVSYRLQVIHNEQKQIIENKGDL
jgi:hypothetical protein